MSPKQEKLTAEQQATIAELQAELDALNLKADDYWSKYVRTGDLDCFNEVVALEGMIEMKGLIAYMPKAGESKIGRIRALVNRVRASAGEPELPAMIDEAMAAYDRRVATLDAVNAFRADLGLPMLDRLPRGVVGDAAECTIARAIALGFEKNTKGLRLVGVSISGGEDNMVEFEDAAGRTVAYRMSGERLAMLRAGYSPLTDDVYDYDDLRVREHLNAGDEAMAAWGSVVSAFDEREYLDLIDDAGPTLEYIVDCIEEGLDFNHHSRFRLALNDLESRGPEVLADAMSTTLGEWLAYADGKWSWLTGKPPRPVVRMGDDDF
jgi:hypothetical protein